MSSGPRSAVSALLGHDADGQVNITDAIRTLNYLFSGTQTVPCLDAADFDDTGAVCFHLHGGVLQGPRDVRLKRLTESEQGGIIMQLNVAQGP